MRCVGCAKQQDGETWRTRQPREARGSDKAQSGLDNTSFHCGFVGDPVDLELRFVSQAQGFFIRTDSSTSNNDSRPRHMSQPNEGFTLKRVVGDGNCELSQASGAFRAPICHPFVQGSWSVTRCGQHSRVTICVTTFNTARGARAPLLLVIPCRIGQRSHPFMRWRHKFC